MVPTKELFHESNSDNLAVSIHILSSLTSFHVPPESIRQSIQQHMNIQLTFTYELFEHRIQLFFFMESQSLSSLSSWGLTAVHCVKNDTLAAFTFLGRVMHAV